MATRGTAIIINDDMVNFGPEFNGDMYPHGHGDDFMKTLATTVNDNKDFIIFNNRFNKYNFQYDKIMSCYQGKFNYDELTNDENVITIDKLFNIATSDYLFIKNLSKKQIKIEVLNENYDKININVRSGETIRTNFRVFIKNDRIK